MYKIKYIPTGHIFILPEAVALELKEKSPADYQIVEKNGKKFKDSVKVEQTKAQPNSILLKVLDSDDKKSKRQRKR